MLSVHVPAVRGRTRAAGSPSRGGRVPRSARASWLSVACAASVGFVSLLPGVVRADDDVLVTIRGPLVGRVGEKVSFDVELVNRSGRNLEKLRVIDYFDAGFRHEASTSPIEQKGTIDLAVGTARRVTLDFTLAEPGRQCHRVEILDPTQRFVGGATECVQVTAATPAATQAPAPVQQSAPAVVQQPAAPLAPPPAMVPSVTVPPTPPPASVAQPLAPPTVTAPLPTASASTVPLAPPASPALALDLTGPVEVLSDGVAAFVATVRNTGNGPSAATSLTFSWDEGFVPLEASDGYELGPAKVSWKLPSLEPGGRLERQINLRAEAPADAYSDSSPTRSCIRAELGGLGGGAVVGDIECVQIRSNRPRPRRRTPADAGLRLSLADLDDPVVLGDATTLVCTVFNDGSTASGPLSLAIDLPQGARLVGDSRTRVDGGRIFFDGVDVPAGSQRSFEIAYTLSAAGRGIARASLSGTGLDGRIDRSCETVFLVP